MDLTLKGVDPKDLKTVLGIVAGYSENNEGKRHTYQLSETKLLKLSTDGENIEATVIESVPQSEFDRLKNNANGRRVYFSMDDYLNGVKN